MRLSSSNLVVALVRALVAILAYLYEAARAELELEVEIETELKRKLEIR